MRRLFIIVGGGLMALGAFIFALQLKTKTKYDDATGFFQKAAVISRPATEEDDQFIERITREWDRHDKRGMTPEDLSGVLKLAGYPNTLSGLVEFQTHVVPPYSYFDHERNKIEVIRAATLNVGSPIAKGEMVVSKNYVFHQQESGLTHLFRMSDDGIQHVIFTEPKKQNKAQMATPRKSSD